MRHHDHVRSARRLRDAAEGLEDGDGEGAVGDGARDAEAALARGALKDVDLEGSLKERGQVDAGQVAKRAQFAKRLQWRTLMTFGVMSSTTGARGATRDKHTWGERLMPGEGDADAVACRGRT